MPHDARLLPALALVLVACEEPEASLDGPDTPPTATADTGTEPVDCDLAYPGSGARCGLLQVFGDATLPSFDEPADYQGTERAELTADFGDGEVLCEVTWQIASTGARQDCSSCIWAFDMAISGAAITAGEQCDPLFEALGVSGLEGLNGTTFAMGFNPEFAAGHSEVRMIYEPNTSSWQGAGFVFLDPKKNGFTYVYIDGNHAY